ncbi:alpha/beta hydrolase [Gordonia jinhuaensis]|uniref:Alpha/beta hydrolase n=1 Tax=Gordonia jinhuaensis TaxID=1517702 RepID=A0A916WN90_9ACTN|nr:alpha/beta hydrolase [Gordonia jinhuaensis]GGB18583.1 alpha/beta hydrolase [Gordonia jinhuaensis]
MITAPHVRRSLARRALTLSVLVTSAVLLTSGLTACDSGVTGSPERVTGSDSVSEPAGDRPTTIDGFYAQTLRWGSCESMISSDIDYPSDGSSCARVLVPVDYADPAGDTASLALFRYSAPGGSARIGSLLMNPGGPGGSGVDFMAGQAADLAKHAIGEHFDLVGFDPRGVGHSTPAIHCLSDSDRDADRARDDTDWSPSGIAEREAHNAQFGRACADQLGTEFLSKVGTVDVVRDLDVIRAMLRDDKLNYLGFSYGTRIGSAYAEAFPTRVRAMVNDGAVDPSQNPVDEQLAQTAGFQHAFDAFAADCTTRSDCALGTDAGAAVSRFWSLTRPLIGHPAATTDPRGLSYSDAMTGVAQALYSPELWQYLRTGLAELRAGRGDTLLRLADIYEGRDDAGHYDPTSDAFTAIRCVDGPAITDRATVDSLERRSRQVAPFTDDGRGTGHGVKDECAFWPVPPTSQPHRVSAPGLPTTVVVSTTNDPATPYAAGQSLAAQMDARLITVTGTQHTASYDGNACVDRAVDAYLVNLTLPPENLRC